MKKTFSRIMIVLLLTGALALSLNVQQVECPEPPETEWNQTYGGPADDLALSLVQTDDGGYALAGRTKSFGAGGYDFWLVKTDSSGDMEWNETYGGPNGDTPNSMVQTSDGGYVLAGHTGSDPHRDVRLVKVNAAGTIEWDETYGGSNDDVADSVVQTSDGGYAIAGQTTSYGAGYFDAWLIKINSDGTPEWNKTYGGIARDGAWSLVRTDDGGYAIAGRTRSFSAGDSDVYLVKTNATGDMEWSRTYGGTKHDYGYSVVQTVDGGYAIAGSTFSYGAGSSDLWLVKTDAAGNMVWSQIYGGANRENAISMKQTADGGYVLAGYTESYGAGDLDCWLVKTDSDGSMEWHRTDGGPSRELASAVVQTVDGGYAIAGQTESYGAGNLDFWLIKLAPEEILATIDIDPDTLNLKSNGQWITAYIELPEEYSVSEIDVSSILLNESISVDPDAPTAIGDHDVDSIPDLMVKFERAPVMALLGTHDYGEDTGKSVDVALVITGEAAGTPFEGVDTIRVLLKG